MKNEDEFCIEERRLTREDIQGQLQEYEKKYGMSSKEFYEKWKRGEADFVAESVVWSDLYMIYQYMNGELLAE